MFNLLPHCYLIICENCPKKDKDKSLWGTCRSLVLHMYILICFCVTSVMFVVIQSSIKHPRHANVFKNGYQVRVKSNIIGLLQ